MCCPDASLDQLVPALQLVEWASRHPKLPRPCAFSSCLSIPGLLGGLPASPVCSLALVTTLDELAPANLVPAGELVSTNLLDSKAWYLAEAACMLGLEVDPADRLKVSERCWVLQQQGCLQAVWPGLTHAGVMLGHPSPRTTQHYTSMWKLLSRQLQACSFLLQPLTCPCPTFRLRRCGMLCHHVYAPAACTHGTLVSTKACCL